MQELGHQSNQERYEQIKRDFTFGLAPTKNNDKIVLHNDGFGYAHYRVRVVYWPKEMQHKYTMKDVAIVASKGYMPFGWRTEGNAVCIYTD